MPSSDAMTIYPVLKLVGGFQPKSILDIGCGNGKYGFLFREILDLNYGRMAKKQWAIKIDGIEIEKNYRNVLHDFFYNSLFWEDWLEAGIEGHYDIAFMGDVLEHFENGQWQKALDKAKQIAHIVITVCPNWDGSINQGAVFGNEAERHKIVLNPSCIGGKCVWANTKAFISVHSNKMFIIEKDVLL